MRAPSPKSSTTKPTTSRTSTAQLVLPQRPIANRTECWRRLFVALCCAAGLTLAPRLSAARSAPVLVELDDSTEPLLDARATRRLVALELADIDVALPGSKRASVPLFFRVVRVEQNLRVELWERGEYHGARLISGSNALGQLGARRVALAAAELARRLQKKRQIQAARERALALAESARVAREARRALDGPMALRPSLELAQIGDQSATFIGSRLLAQWAFVRRTRLDLGVTWLAGAAPDGARAEWAELSLAPMQRVALAETLDLDLGVTLAAAWLRFSRVRGVDALADQHETWSARAAAVARLEPGLSRRLRLSIGAEAGLALREIPFQPISGGSDRLHGMWLSLGLGVVFTPR